MPKKLPKKKSSFFRLLVISLIGICMFMGIIFVIKGYINRKWDGQTRFTVISISPEILIKSFDVRAGEGIILKLPDNLKIESVMGRGEWLADVIGEAGEAKWAAGSVADYLGISFTAIEEELEWWDKLMWISRSKKVTWREIGLAGTAYVEKQTQPDGLEVLVLGSNWDLKSRELFYDHDIAVQALGVEIINTTSASGLGASAARVVESMGLKVRDLSSSQDPVEGCVIRSRADQKKNIAVRKLLKIFHCRWEAGDTGDLVLVLGKEYLYWKSGN